MIHRNGGPDMRLERLVSRIFIIAELIIYISFITLDLSGLIPGYSDNVRLFTGIKDACSDHLKYSGIVLVFTHALFLCIRNFEKKHLLIAGALFFTATADIFLLFFAERLFIIPGLVSFCITQTIYSFLLTDGKALYKRFPVPCIFLVTAIVLAACAGKLLVCDSTVILLLTLVLYYAAMFVRNTIISWCDFIKFRRRFHLMFSMGLTLFMLCDINVLIRNLNSFYSETVPAGMVSMAVFLSWVFYLPSQVLISLSPYMLKTSKDAVRPLKQ